MESVASPRRMRAVLLAGAIALGTAASARAESPSRTVAEEGPIRVGAPAPTFAGWDLGQRMVSLRDLLDSPRRPSSAPVVISYFATWCEPCKKGLPAVAKVQRETGARTLLVAVGQRADEFRGWLQEQRIELPAIADPFMKISERWGVDKALPRTFVLDAKGTVRAIFVLEGDDFEDALREAIRAARVDAPASSTATEGAAPKPAKG